jgi:hypothetical protein
MRLLILLCLVLWVINLDARDETALVPLCQILAHPQMYDGKDVLTSGIVSANRESSQIFDPSCAPGPLLDVAVALTPATDKVMRTRGWKSLMAVLKTSPAFAVVRVTFDAINREPNPQSAAPPIADPVLRGILDAQVGRFGHLGFARFRMRVVAVEYSVRATDLRN